MLVDAIIRDEKAIARYLNVEEYFDANYKRTDAFTFYRDLFKANGLLTKEQEIQNIKDKNENKPATYHQGTGIGKILGNGINLRRMLNRVYKGDREYLKDHDIIPYRERKIVELSEYYKRKYCWKNQVGTDWKNNRQISNILNHFIFGAAEANIFSEDLTDYNEKLGYLIDNMLFDEVDNLQVIPDYINLSEFDIKSARKKGSTLEKTLWVQSIYDDLNAIRMFEGHEGIIYPYSTYKRSTSRFEYAHEMFAVVIDLDLCDVPELEELPTLRGYPIPTYIVNSGTGVHIYYMLDKPVTCYPMKRKNEPDEIFQLFKDVISYRQYEYNVTSKKDYLDVQPIEQAYRAIGSNTKLGSKYPVTAYRWGDFYSLEELWDKFLTNSPQKIKWDIPDKLQRFIKGKKKAEYTSQYLALFKEPYEPPKLKENEDSNKDDEDDESKKKKILSKQTEARNLTGYLPKTYEMFNINRHVGNRYHLCCLAYSNAYWGGYTKEEVTDWILENLDWLNEVCKNKSEYLTVEEVMKASEHYDNQVAPWRLDTVNKLCDMNFKHNRPAKTREDHLGFLHYMMHRGAYGEVYFTSESGREAGKIGGKIGGKKSSRSKEQLISEYIEEHPDATNTEIAENTGVSERTVRKYTRGDSKEHIVFKYLDEHPNAKKSDVIRDTGISKMTVYKYWDKYYNVSDNSEENMV